MEGAGGACPSRQAPWPAGDSRPRSRRGPRVKPVTPDPCGPSGGQLYATVRIASQRASAGRAARIGTRSGLDAGGWLRTMRASLSRTQPQQGPRPAPLAPAPPKPGTSARRARPCRRRRRPTRSGEYAVAGSAPGRSRRHRHRHETPAPSVVAWPTYAFTGTATRAARGRIRRAMPDLAGYVWPDSGTGADTPMKNTPRPSKTRATLRRKGGRPRTPPGMRIIERARYGTLVQTWNDEASID